MSKKQINNKNKDNQDEKDNQNDSEIDNHFNENRPFSFTSRNYFLKNNYTYNGFDYILGNSNPNNIYNKGFIDNKKSDYNYKNFTRGKRNNYVNKKIFFNQNNIKNLPKINEVNLNYNQNNENENQKIINNNSENFGVNQNTIQSNQNYIFMNEVINTDNLDLKIMNIANNILSNIGYKDEIIGNNSLLQYLFN